MYYLGYIILFFPVKINIDLDIIPVNIMKLIRMTDSASEKKITRQTKGQHKDKETVIPLHSMKKGTFKLFELPITLRKYPKLLQTLKKEKTGLSDFFLTDVFQIKCMEVLSINLMVEKYHFIFLI